MIGLLGLCSYSCLIPDERESINHDDHHVTIFTQEIGGFDGRFGVYIVPRFKLTFFLLSHYDYVEMIESDQETIAIRNDSLKIYIPPNKVYIHLNGNRFEMKENSIVHLKNYSGFDNVDVYYGDKSIKRQYLVDTENYWVKTL